MKLKVSQFFLWAQKGKDQSWEKAALDMECGRRKALNTNHASQTEPFWRMRVGWADHVIIKSSWAHRDT